MRKQKLFVTILLLFFCLTGKADNLAFRGLVNVAIMDRIRLHLDKDQLSELKEARLHLDELKMRYETDSLSSTIDSINDYDHRVALNVLTQKQFRRVVLLNYRNMVEDRDKIWARIDSAGLTSDLDKNKALYQIQQYLVDVRTAEETYWNDKEMRNKARHQVKVFAPQVVKRYFSTRKNKESNSKKQEMNNYIW